MYFGRSVLASPLHPKSGSGRPLSVTQIGDWSTPMNHVFGLSWAAFVVADARLKPTVTMTSYFWSISDWMSCAYSAWSLGTIETGSAAPTECAPSTAPLYEYSLKFLSFSDPMSVTTPILRLAPALDAALADDDAEPEADADAAEDSDADGDAAADALVDAAALGAADWLAAALDAVPVELHAPTMSATDASSVAPRERLRMVPPLCGRRRGDRAHAHLTSGGRRHRAFYRAAARTLATHRPPSECEIAGRRGHDG